MGEPASQTDGWPWRLLHVVGNYLKHQSYHEYHGHTGHNIGMVLNDELMAQKRRVFVALRTSYSRHFAGINSTESGQLFPGRGFSAGKQEPEMTSMCARRTSPTYSAQWLAETKLGQWQLRLLYELLFWTWLRTIRGVLFSFKEKTKGGKQQSFCLIKKHCNVSTNGKGISRPQILWPIRKLFT